MKKIWDEYPKKSEYKDARDLYNRLIKGDLLNNFNSSKNDNDLSNDGAWENTCAARMSRALNYAGIRIPEKGFGLTAPSNGSKF